MKSLPSLSILSRLSVKSEDLKVSLIFLGLSLVLAYTTYWAYLQFMTSPPYVDPQRYPIKGIDVSAHNGKMNLKKAVAEEGIDFIFIKASEGDTFRDRRFEENYEKAREAGLKIGAYHYFRFDCDGVSQGMNLVNAISGKQLDLGVAVDVEESGNAVGIDSIAIARRIEAMANYLNLCGYRVTYYSNVDGFYRYLHDVVPGACLWICSFHSHPIDAEWTFWQFNHHGRLKGISGDVDLDVFCGSEEEWQNYLNGAQWPYETPPHLPSDSLSLQ